MSAKELFREIVSDIRVDVGAEVGRLAVQGQAEMASALFTGSAFVPYGEGQLAVEAPQQAQTEPQHGLPVEAMKAPEVQQEMERGGRE
ncbi:hypothetical protein GobsT_51230 [Gemmata obscuriglobus]|nr:hypothetical protein [Gemmata obscuriglobus]QEG30318.1 hypothetical protein GobsT_51230 [Gemmata obscuriglobus]VTS09642.1 unnamed protein product [Gemmata obscuriglobus UQM 2246]